ncbi:unnamed protein product [Protopolystoma xenopodis]|uniref:Uncharacterized protein n=1 Tax=Protopolystoma xenopodis TaxID=117903 RepID=A0A3S5A9A4_9PLAT|nr:unnamed protein product [Protopolystoma xenopodis]
MEGEETPNDPHDILGTVQKGNVEDLKNLYSKLPEIFSRSNDNGDFIAHMAAKHGRSDILQWLNSIKCKFNDEFNTAGFLPIHVAVLHGNLDCVLALKMGGANMDAISESDELTPLHLACRNGNVSIINVLANANANLLAKDAYGNKPIDIAVNYGQAKAAEILAKKMGIATPEVVALDNDPTCKRITEEQKKQNLKKLKQRIRDTSTEGT